MQETSLSKPVVRRATLIASSTGSDMQIILLAIGTAVVYGLLQDQVTARVCVEYFTIGHYDYWNLQDPTLLALEWGVVATWWVGLFLGIALTISARIGRRRPGLTAHDLLRPALLLLASTGIIALAAGIIGYFLARSGAVFLVKPLATVVPPAKQVAFLADLWAHTAAYLAGFLGGIVLCFWSWHQRGRLQAAQSDTGHSNRVESNLKRWERIVLSALVVIGCVGLALGILFLMAVNMLQPA